MDKELKKCCSCKLLLFEDRFTPYEWKYGSSHTCRECRYRNNARNRWNLKLEMIQAYGGSCNCCGELEPKFLTLDHINGGGSRDRGIYAGGTYNLLYALKREGWPKDKYQVLCMNCNWAKGRWEGICPHQNIDNDNKYDNVRNK